MKTIAKKLIQQSFEAFGVGITRHETLQRLRKNESTNEAIELLKWLKEDAVQKLSKKERDSDDIEFLKSLNEDAVGKAVRLLEVSKSQLRQDLFVLAELRFKRNGFFVEFGATDGFDLSNTYLLENDFNWKGILAEPARVWRKDLVKNRNAKIDFDCIWKESGKKIKFNETIEPVYSTITEFNAKDSHAEIRRSGNSYAVKTVSLLDLLERHSAPRRIDYLSIDTEGSEYEILRHFDFNAYQFSIITCEHNFTSDRGRIFELLTAKGFVRKFEHLSKFDDWYVRPNLLS